jgi:YVTN family beta-propeller protein
VQFRILGRLEVYEGPHILSLGGPRPKALLAMLLLNRGQVVSSDRLVDALWGEHPPPTAGKAVQVYVSQLRKVLGDGVLQTHGRGYMLDVPPEAVDAGHFQALSREGRVALQAGRVAEASEQLRAALGLWRGSPLSDFEFDDFAQSAIAQLNEGRLAAVEDRIDADLSLGAHEVLIAELEALTLESPLRERLQGQLMLALYRAGRQVEALDRYRRARQALMDDLGLLPGRALAELEQAILSQSPELDLPGAAPGPTLGGRRMTRGGALLVGGGALLLVAAIAALLASSKTDRATSVSANSVAVVDAKSGKLLDDVAVGGRPTDIAPAAHAVWVANLDDNSISEIDRSSREVLSTTAPRFSIGGLAADSAGLWLSDLHAAAAVRLDPTFRSVIRKISIATSAPFMQADGPVALGAGSVWIGNGHASIIRIDEATGAVRARIEVGNNPDGIAVGLGAVWVIDRDDGTLVRIDPATNAVTATVPIGQEPAGIAVGAGAVWVANTGEDKVVRVDPETATVTTTVPVGRRPSAVIVAGRSVWAANSLSGSITRIDPQSNRVTATVDLGESPQSLAFADGKLWVGVARAPNTRSATEADHRDGTLKVLLTQDPGSTDPAQFSGDFQRAYATCALLLNYPDQALGAGDHLVPEVASGQPTVSEDGRTYTYKIRTGFRFSPPSNQEVTASAFKRAIERALSPALHSYAAGFIGDIVGANAYLAGRSVKLEGVRVAGDKLEVHLLRAAPDLPARLATPWFCAVPPDAPSSASTTSLIPGAGPYYTAARTPNRSVVLRRNPHYHGARPRRAKEIDYEVGIPPAQAIREVTAGRADYYGNNGFGSYIPAASQTSLAARLGSTSAAARSGHQQYYVEPQLSVYSLLFNTHRPPFDDRRLRQAVNYALDRRALAAVAFPGSTAKPTDQYLPPGVPGFRDATIYPLGAPNLAKARQLAGDVHVEAVLDTCNLAPCTQFAQIVREDLAPIGVAVKIHPLAISRLFDAVGQRQDQQFDLAQYPYAADFPDPFDFINRQFESSESLNRLFSDASLDRNMSAAGRLAGGSRYRAYSQLDAKMAAGATPAAAYASGTTTALLSARTGCQLDQPVYGIDLGALCLRR